MSSADARFPGRSIASKLILPALLGLSLLAAGCQVRPLYGEAGGGGTLSNSATGETIDLSSISIKPVSTRPALVVRNHLIFLLNGGSEPAQQTRYSVTLNVTARTSSAAYVQVASEDEPTAGTVTMQGRYEIVDTQAGEVIHRGSRQVFASFDVSRQAFSALRAERDAQDRAGRELAELLRLAIVQDLTRGTRGSSSIAAPITEVTPRPGDQTTRPVSN